MTNVLVKKNDLHESASSGNYEQLKQVLEENVSCVDEYKNGRTALMLAASNGHTQVHILTQ